MKRLEKNYITEGRRVRFTNFVDLQSESFEEKATFLEAAAIEQTLAYLKTTKRPFYLLQISDMDSEPLMQGAVFIGRNRFLPFAMATASNLPHARTIHDEEFGIKILKECCSDIPGVMTLRLRPKRFSNEHLDVFEHAARNIGYEPAPPIGPIRTLILKIDSSIEDLHASFPQRTRQRLRHVGQEKIEIRTIVESKFVKPCQEALTASRLRSGGTPSNEDLEAAFELARMEPHRAKILGLFAKDEPDKLLAFVSGFVNGKSGEYSYAGAYNHPLLRSMPYNYFLLWELIKWEAEEGCTSIDLGGVTDESENDPLKGVSQFKRSITKNELEIGREMTVLLRPLRYWIYSWLKKLSSRELGYR